MIMQNFTLSLIYHKNERDMLATILKEHKILLRHNA